MANLGVNIDHLAFLRQLRGTPYPDIIKAVEIIERAGADGIVLHLREDRRHIQEKDVRDLRKTIKTKMNLEMAATPEMVKIAKTIKPDDVCLVPEKREELTTEGGLDILKNKNSLERVVAVLKENGIKVSLFIEPDPNQIELAKTIKADIVELHTGAYCNEQNDFERIKRLGQIIEAVKMVKKAGLICNAGHGLDYENIKPLVKERDISEFNIGHSLICRAAFVGLEKAVKEMLKIVKRKL